MVVLAVLTPGCIGLFAPQDYTPWEPPVREPEPYDGDLPAIGDALVRPGARLSIGGGSCTANFVFRSSDGTRLYLGAAAHCFGDPEAGTGGIAQVPGFGVIGRVAYNAWSHGTDTPDFGLIELHNTEAVRQAVHPAMIHYGGPTGIRDSANVLPGTKVLTYGNSTLRPTDDPDNPREGWILMEDQGLFKYHTEHPGVPGDSGSGMITSDGQALCVVVLAFVNPLWEVLGQNDTPNLNWCEPLDRALEHAALHDPDLEGLEIVTWEQLRGPKLPV